MTRNQANGLGALVAMLAAVAVFVLLILPELSHAHGDHPDPTYTMEHDRYVFQVDSTNTGFFETGDFTLVVGTDLIATILPDMPGDVVEVNTRWEYDDQEILPYTVSGETFHVNDLFWNTSTYDVLILDIGSQIYCTGWADWSPNRVNIVNIFEPNTGSSRNWDETGNPWTGTVGTYFWEIPTTVLNEYGEADDFCTQVAASCLASTPGAQWMSYHAGSGPHRDVARFQRWGFCTAGCDLTNGPYPGVAQILIDFWPWMTPQELNAFDCPGPEPINPTVCKCQQCCVLTESKPRTRKDATWGRVKKLYQQQ